MDEWMKLISPIFLIPLIFPISPPNPQPPIPQTFHLPEQLKQPYD